MEGKVPTALTGGRAIDVYNPLGTYPGSVGEVQIKLVFTLHNFKDGFMKVMYTRRTKNEKGVLLSASIDVPATWIIQKENGKWEIVAIKENP